jgi:hypothetical protein
VDDTGSSSTVPITTVSIEAKVSCRVMLECHEG